MLHKKHPLAVHGGPKVRDTLFPAHITVGHEEKMAVNQVLDSGILSNYLGAYHENFMGGATVRACEKAWAARFGAEHALSVNSNTSGLIAALGAIGIGPGDEVIVTAYSMSASATAPLIYGALPVFADVEPDMFCLDATSIEAVITPNTRAILIVDLFGQPFNASAIRSLAKKHSLVIIEDCAQAPGASLDGENAGLLGDIGVFSLNYHKHIHCGEGCLWNTHTGVDRNIFVDAVKAELPCFKLRETEGVKLGAGYVRPIYLLPVFQQRQSIGSSGDPLVNAWQSFEPGLCPVVEDLHFQRLVTHEFIVPSMQESDIDDVVRAFEKVWDQRDTL